MATGIIIYEDNNALRDSLADLVKNTPGLSLLEAFPDCSSVLDDCHRYNPEVILMDIDMPVISGIQATAMIKESYPSINIMMLTVYEDRDKVFDALCAGATGYMLKKSTGKQITDAIKELVNGGSPMTGEIARKVLEFFSKPTAVKNNEYALSTRELEILKCLVNGQSYKMIANTCYISIGTVYSHINSIYKKLTVNSKSEAVIKAMRERLV